MILILKEGIRLPKWYAVLPGFPESLGKFLVFHCKKLNLLLIRRENEFSNVSLGWHLSTWQNHHLVWHFFACLIWEQFRTEITGVLSDQDLYVRARLYKELTHSCWHSALGLCRNCPYRSERESISLKVCCLTASSEEEGKKPVAHSEGTSFPLPTANLLLAEAHFNSHARRHCIFSGMFIVRHILHSDLFFGIFCMLFIWGFFQFNFLAVSSKVNCVAWKTNKHRFLLLFQLFFTFIHCRFDFWEGLEIPSTYFLCNVFLYHLAVCVLSSSGLPCCPAV